MGKHYICDKCVCPYYKYEARCKIYCYAEQPVLAIHNVFASKQDLRAYRKKRCEKLHSECPIAVGMRQKED